LISYFYILPSFHLIYLKTNKFESLLHKKYNFDFMLHKIIKKKRLYINYCYHIWSYKCFRYYWQYWFYQLICNINLSAKCIVLSFLLNTTSLLSIKFNNTFHICYFKSCTKKFESHIPIFYLSFLSIMLIVLNFSNKFINSFLVKNAFSLNANLPSSSSFIKNVLFSISIHHRICKFQ
jgi:hypothetical protein